MARDEKRATRASDEQEGGVDQAPAFPPISFLLIVPLDGEPYIADDKGTAPWLIQAALYEAAAGYFTELVIEPEGEEE
jgi:hypothetical protein